MEMVLQSYCTHLVCLDLVRLGAQLINHVFPLESQPSLFLLSLQKNFNTTHEFPEFIMMNPMTCSIKSFNL